MTLQDRLRLINAGYTKQEIERMEMSRDTSRDTSKGPAPIQEPETPPAPSDPSPVPEPEKIPESSTSFDTVMSEINKLKDRIIATNIQQRTAPTTSKETADDILRQILDPNYKRKELS